MVTILTFCPGKEAELGINENKTKNIVQTKTRTLSKQNIIIDEDNFENVDSLYT